MTPRPPRQTLVKPLRKSQLNSCKPVPTATHLPQSSPCTNSPHPPHPRPAPPCPAHPHPTRPPSFQRPVPQAPDAHPPRPSSARAPRRRWRGSTAPTHTPFAPPGKEEVGGRLESAPPPPKKHTHPFFVHRQGLCVRGWLDSAHIRTTVRLEATEQLMLLRPFPHTAPLDS